MDRPPPKNETPTRRFPKRNVGQANGKEMYMDTCKPFVPCIIRAILFVFLINCPEFEGRAQAMKPIPIESRLELFVDNHLIEKLEKASLKLHSPVPREIAFYEDAPWEGNYGGYHSVIKDGEQFRYYYRGTQRLDDGINKFAHMVTCTTISSDGIRWERPSLGLFEFNGSKDNNIIWKNDSGDGFKGYSSCFMVSLNGNPKARSEEKFIAMAHTQEARKDSDGNPIARHVIFTSPDGVNFTMKPDAVMELLRGDAGGDTVIWDPNLGQYAAYMRAYWNPGNGAVTGYGQKGLRQVVRSLSPDLTHWSKPELVRFGDATPENLYTLMPEPYFRAPHIYIGLSTRFMENRRAVKDWWRDGVNDGVLVSSRDGLNWNRTFMEAFLRPGRDVENWTSRATYLTRGVVQTGPDEMSVYWFEHADHGPKDMRVRRGTLRLDGFISVNGPYAGGEMLTKPITFTGRQLVLNYSTSAAGSVQVEIQDEKGAVIPGYALTDCPEKYGDEIEGVISWKKGSSVSDLAGKPVRLRFVLKDADLYSMQFAE
jgi:hypothetical protein